MNCQSSRQNTREKKGKGNRLRSVGRVWRVPCLVNTERGARTKRLNGRSAAAAVLNEAFGFGGRRSSWPRRFCSKFLHYPINLQECRICSRKKFNRIPHGFCAQSFEQGIFKFRLLVFCRVKLSKETVTFEYFRYHKIFFQDY